MGAIAELIKAAEEKQAISPSVVADKLDVLQRHASSLPPVSEALQSLSQKAPTAEQESGRSALKWIAITGLGAAGVGALLRLMRARREAASRRKLYDEVDPYAGVPGREITVPIPKMPKQGMDKSAAGLALPAAAIAAASAPAAMRAAGTSVGGLWEKAKGGVTRGFEHLFAPTGSPFDAPWFLPTAIAAGLGGGYLGYKQLDKVLEKMRERRSERQLAAAKQEFEEALRTQYREAELAERATKGGRRVSGVESEGGFKFSSAGMMGFVADTFAQAHVNGELEEQFASLEKSAQTDESGGWTKGLGRKSLGAYLAMLAILAAAGGAAGYSFVKGREPERRKHELAKEILRRRSLATPPTVSVEPT
jgi:hypothetical protein